ncbi:MAG TPA: AAA family ATPase [Ktedonobacterales bacterium]|nr:AAA family ATPase [Ktedonobacterales bacterium]
MKRILITGMSGTGKSTVVEALAARGFKAVDADGDEYSEWAPSTLASDAFGPPVQPDRDWVWREDRVEELLSTEDSDVLFVSGCAENMGQFMPRFDHVVLLSAPAEVIAGRLRVRTNNPYGKRPEEVARTLSLIQTVEPLLRRVADSEIDTSACLEDVVEQLVRLARSQA